MLLSPFDSLCSKLSRVLFPHLKPDLFLMTGHIPRTTTFHLNILLEHKQDKFQNPIMNSMHGRKYGKICSHVNCYNIDIGSWIYWRIIWIHSDLSHYK